MQNYLLIELNLREDGVKMGENPAESKGEDGFEGDTKMMGDGEDEYVEEGLVGPTYWWSKNPLQYVYTFIVV